VTLPPRSYITSTWARCCGAWPLEVTVAVDSAGLIRLFTRPGDACCPSCGCEGTVADPTRFDAREVAAL